LAENFVTNNAAGVAFLGQGSGVTNVQNKLNGIFLAGVPNTFVNAAGNLVISDPGAGGAGTQVVQQTAATNDTEHWVISPAGGGFCTLVCVTNGLVLGVNGSTTSNAPVVMETYTGAASQLWALAPVTNTYVALTNKLSGMAVHSASSAAGQGLVQRPFNGSTNQQWNLLAAPFGLGATLGTGVTVQWFAYTGATNYTVKRATSANGPYSVIASGLTATSYTDTGVFGGVTYFYEVSASLNGIQTANSAPLSVLVSTLTWDSDGNSANGVTDGNGVWDSTSYRWFGSTNVPDTNWPGGGFTAVFGSTGSGTVTVSGTQSCGGLVFNTGYTLSAGALALATNGPFAVDNNANVTISTLLTGSQTLAKTGPGTLTLSNANTYAGGTTISQAKIMLGQDNALGTGPVTVQSGTGNPTVYLDLNGHALTNPIAGTGGDCYVYNSSASPATLSGSIAFGSYTRIGIYSQTTPGTGNINVPGTLVGGWYEKQGAGVLSLTSTNTYAGNTYITGGAVRAQDGVGITSANLQLAGGVFESLGTGFFRPLGAGAGQVDLSSGNSGFSAYGGPVTIALGGLANPANLVWGTAYFNPSALVLNYNSANASLILSNAVDLNGATRTVYENAAVASIAAPIFSSTGPAGLAMSGTGRLNLNAVNTYTGTTTISNGVLGGIGSLAGPLSILSSGTLNPGQGAGTFTVSNSATLAGTLVLDVNQTNTPNCGQLAATTINCGGVLLVTNLGPALTNRATFKLFTGTLAGSFSATNLPPLGPNLAWSNSLAANGSLTVVSTAAMNPTNLSFQLLNGGATLQLAWPPDHVGWSLQSQTDSLPAGLGSNWVTVAGSAQTNQVWQPLSPANGAVFFRLHSP
jgi:autotransporter-associated beta strand protein